MRGRSRWFESFPFVRPGPLLTGVSSGGEELTDTALLAWRFNAQCFCGGLTFGDAPVETGATVGVRLTDLEVAWRQPVTGTWPDEMADRMIPFAQTIDKAKKYVVSGTLDQVDWTAELVQGDLEKAVQQLKREPGRGLTWEA